VLSGRALHETQSFTAQDPFCRAFIGTAPADPPPTAEALDKTRADAPRSLCVEGGGVQPIWTPAHSNTLTIKQGGGLGWGERRMVWHPEEMPPSITMELWNENTVADDLIGTATIPLDTFWCRYILRALCTILL
jgi:hypothetical protein